MVAESGTSRGKAAVKSGKLIKVDAIFRGDVIESIKITGDFFLHPESRIEEIEERLRGRRVDEVKDIVTEMLGDAEYIGLSVEALTEAVIQAWKMRS